MKYNIWVTIEWEDESKINTTYDEMGTEDEDLVVTVDSVELAHGILGEIQQLVKKYE